MGEARALQLGRAGLSRGRSRRRHGASPRRCGEDRSGRPPSFRHRRRCFGVAMAALGEHPLRGRQYGSARKAEARVTRPIALFRNERRCATLPTRICAASPYSLSVADLSPLSSDLTGKTAIVTSAGARGNSLRRADSIALANAGAAVAVANLNGAGAEEVAAEIIADGGRAIGFQVDLTDAASVQEMTAAAVDVLGGVGILVSNVALMVGGRATMATTKAEFDKFIAVNVWGAINARRRLSRLWPRAEHLQGQVRRLPPERARRMVRRGRATINSPRDFMAGKH